MPLPAFMDASSVHVAPYDAEAFHGSHVPRNNDRPLTQDSPVMTQRYPGDVYHNVASTYPRQDGRLDFNRPVKRELNVPPARMQDVRAIVPVARSPPGFPSCVSHAAVDYVCQPFRFDPPMESAHMKSLAYDFIKRESHWRKHTLKPHTLECVASPQRWSV